MASAASLHGLMSHIQTMEETTMAVLLEALLKQSAMIDANIFVVVDGPRGRKWAGRKSLRDAYLSGTLAPGGDEVEIEVDPGISALVEKNGVFDDVPDCQMFVEAEDTKLLRENDIGDDSSATRKPEPRLFSAEELLSMQPKLPALPKLLPKPNVTLFSSDSFGVAVTHSSTSDRKRTSARSGMSLGKNKSMKLDDSSSKPRTLESAFDDCPNSPFLPEEEEKEPTALTAALNSLDEEQLNAINGHDGMNGQTVYVIKDRYEGSDRKTDIVIRMPSTKIDAVKVESVKVDRSTVGAVESRLRPITPRLVKTPVSPASAPPHMPFNIESVRTELKSQSLDSLESLLTYLRGVGDPDHPIIRNSSQDPESLALDPWTSNRLHFSSVDEWMNLIGILRKMGPLQLFANRDSLTYKLFSAVMRQFSRAVAFECPFDEEKGDNVNRFLGENFDRFMDTFPKFQNEGNFNAILDPRLRKNATSFRGIARKEVQKHYNEHLRNKRTGKLGATTHVLIPVESFYSEEFLFSE